MLIQDGEKATRLARAIFSDLTLYNGDKIARAPDPRQELANEIDEARSLFRSRVLPTHYEIFENMLAAWSPPGGATKPAPAPAAVPVRIEEEPPSEDPKEIRFARGVVVVVVLIFVGVVSTLLYQRHQHEKLEQESHDKHEGTRH